MPDADVSNTTASAPSCSDTIAAASAAVVARPGRRREARDPSIERVADEGRKKAEVEDVAAECKQPAVGEEEGLHDQHGGHDEESGIRPEQDCEQEAAAEMTARSRARDTEVDHLRCEQEGAQHAHQRHPAVVRFAAHLARTPGHRRSRHDAHRAADGGR